MFQYEHHNAQCMYCILPYMCLVCPGLTICGANCLLSADYKSAGKIIARMGQASPGKGDVIVVTRSGGVGKCTVQFKCLKVVPGTLTACWVVSQISEWGCALLKPCGSQCF